MLRGYTDHAAERTLENYGFPLTREIAGDVLARCRRGQCLLVRSARESDADVYLVKLGDGIAFVPVINSKLTSIITVYPFEFLTASAGREHRQSKRLTLETAPALVERRAPYKRRRFGLHELRWEPDDDAG